MNRMLVAKLKDFVFKWTVTLDFAIISARIIQNIDV